MILRPTWLDYGAAQVLHSRDCSNLVGVPGMGEWGTLRKEDAVTYVLKALRRPESRQFPSPRYSAEHCMTSYKTSLEANSCQLFLNIINSVTSVGELLMPLFDSIVLFLPMTVVLGAY